MTVALAVTDLEEPLVKLAQALLWRAPEAKLKAYLERQHRVPVRLSPDALSVLEECLAKGAVLFLAKGGGWRKEGGQRLWERALPPRLTFTGASLQLLRWLLISPEPNPHGVLLKQPLGTGDEVLLAAALAATAGSPWQEAIAAQPLVRASPLCVAGFAGELSAARPLEAAAGFDLAPGGWQVFALQSLAELFAHHWAECEFEKLHEPSPQRLKQVSLGQARALDALFEAAKPLGARPALGFLLEAGRLVLSAGLTAEAYGSGIKGRATLRERSEARQASGAFLRGLMRLRALDAEHRHTRFTDEGYETAQALVARWEASGPSPSQWAAVEPLLITLGAA